MMQLNRRFDFLSKRARRGVSLLWIIIAFPALILFLVFAVEIGNIWLARIELEQSLEANALAAVKQWYEGGVGDTENARIVGNVFSTANPVRGQQVNLTDTTLNTAFGLADLNYDPSMPNDNAFCTDISAYDDYVQQGVMVFGAIIQTENNLNASESVVFNADVEPSCTGLGPGLLIDASSAGNLGNDDDWGISFAASQSSAVNASLRIYRIEIDVNPGGGIPDTGLEFDDSSPVLSSNNTPHKIWMGNDGQEDNVFSNNALAVLFDVDPANDNSTNILEITFGGGVNPFDGLAPGDRFRFGAAVREEGSNGGSGQQDADEIGDITEVRIYYSVNGAPDSMVTQILANTTYDKSDCDFPRRTFTDSAGVFHFVVSGPGNGIPDLPCPPTDIGNDGVGNDGQAYIQAFPPGEPIPFAVRAQATIGVKSVVQSICGFPLGPWGVSAKATAFYDCDANEPKLIHVDVFQCDPPMN